MELAIDRPATDVAADGDARPLAGRRVAITGGTTGIGRAIAITLARAGARIFICGRSQDHLDDALAAIGDVGQGDGIALDLADPDNNVLFIDRAVAAMGGIDVAVFNAAIAAGALTDMDEADLRRAIATDFTAYLLGAHAAAGVLGDDGAIVLIGSMSAHVLGPKSTVYAGIKYGIQGFAEALRRELGPKGISVSLVEPGKTGSNMQYPDIPDDKQREMIGKEEMLRAEDIAAGVLYLLVQPRRVVVQQLTIVPRLSGGE
ncbi:SDR family oxidoreductase [uncultured Sphingomonas sp.]|uniref:SDR family oxidoreductase n=1 Tax=uncultured Sphingomonas sp. TaxID=158754 RepID=UPI0035CBA8CD